MVKNHLRPITVLLLFACVYLQCKTKGKQQQDYGTGVIFADASDLRGIQDAELPHGLGELSSREDLSVDMPPVGNQGKQNSCVAWTAAYALKYFHERQDIKQNILFSPAYIYNQINNGRDMGSRFRDALNIISQQGAGLWDDMPYNEGDYLTQPSENAKQKAKPYNILAYQDVTVIDHMQVKRQIGIGNPVMIAAETDEGFKKAARNGQDEYVWKSHIGAKLSMGHALLVVGYDDSKNAFKVMNSWGNSWGNDGYCWIDYTHFEKVAVEGYIALDIRNRNVEEKPRVDTAVVDPGKQKKAEFYNIHVSHNQIDPTWGYVMKITGVANIPQGVGRTFQISTHFYLSNSTIQVGSLQSPTFADVNGYAATATILYSIPPEGLNHWPFEIFIPYSAFNTQPGRTHMYAIPTLFIDNFAYAKGDAINFYYDK